jgi:hypothetical protein
LDVDAQGWVYVVGSSGSSFKICRSTNALDATATVRFDLSKDLNLGGGEAIAIAALNPEGLVGQPCLLADQSTGPGRGNIYVLCSVLTPDSRVQLMFARSSDAAQTWSAPLQINDDVTNRTAAHWFGTLSLAPNGRLDACWYDTRHSLDNSSSELYYANSYDGGLTWSTNRPISAPFNHRIGYPVQRKIGDYIGMASFEDRVYIAYTATFNQEEDIFFRRIDFPILTNVQVYSQTVTLSWTAVPGAVYTVQSKDNVTDSWSTLASSLLATSQSLSITDSSWLPQRFYRVLREL